jgi:hypothetical protein
MRTRSRIVIVWLAAAFVVAGAALSFAEAGDNHGADVSAVAKPTATPSNEHGKETSEAAKNKEKNESGGEQAGERKRNHGFYVSAAAHCEDVNDPETSGTDFNVPADCETNGQSHGKYVSSVAKSSVGKSNKGPKGGDGS